MVGGGRKKRLAISAEAGAGMSEFGAVTHAIVPVTTLSRPTALRCTLTQTSDPRPQLPAPTPVPVPNPQA